MIIKMFCIDYKFFTGLHNLLPCTDNQEPSSYVAMILVFILILIYSYSMDHTDVELVISRINN